MNLTIIKNLFGSDRKENESVKIGRFLRRSFRSKRSSHLMESNREKRKSGKNSF